MIHDPILRIMRKSYGIAKKCGLFAFFVKKDKMRAIGTWLASKLWIFALGGN
jgi:hypothetical protein